MDRGGDGASDGRLPDSLVTWLAWLVLAGTVLVILGGAVVRATESGAGCGDHWPRCDGHIFPALTDQSTLIEYLHRATTGVLGLLGVALLVAVWRRHTLRGSLGRAVLWSAGLFAAEVLIGAALVRFGWVEHDASVGRVIAVSLHLVNTFLLLGALTLVIHIASGRPAPRLVPRRRSANRVVLGGTVAMLLIGATGALNALADTLFPAQGAAATTGVEHFLIDVRAVHPATAVIGGILIFVLARHPALGDGDGVRRLGLAVQGIIVVQALAGVVNIALLTPVETQVLHLLIADVLWITWVLLGARALEADTRTAPRRVAAA